MGLLPYSVNIYTQEATVADPKALRYMYTQEGHY